MATLEAMACGLAVVGGRRPGASDLLEEEERASAIMVPRGDADALASALGGLLDEAHEPRRLGAART